MNDSIATEAGNIHQRLTHLREALQSENTNLMIDALMSNQPVSDIESDSSDMEERLISMTKDRS